jgi:hypothetical protein
VWARVVVLIATVAELRGQLQPVEQQLLVGLGVTTQDEGSVVGRCIDHLDGGEFLQGRPWGQPQREGAQTRLQGDLKTISVRSCSVIRWASFGLRPSASAICVQE